MKKTLKGFASLLVILNLFCLAVVPALAYTQYTATTNYYSTRNTYSSNFYNTGYTYTTRTIYYNYNTGTAVKPTTPAQTPAPAATPVPAPVPAPTPAPAPTTGTGLAAEEAKMVSLVNQERMGQGLKPLGVNSQLTSLARLKSEDMVKNNYFSHNSPTYGSPFDMMKNAGIRYSTAGENLAGASTTESAHQNLMNSAGHRANILNASFTQIGIGIASGSPYGKIFTQMFIGI
jgi:uncharacterized YkwD family protein